MKKYKLFRPRIRSRHPSHSQLRPKYKELPLLPFRSIIRFGSFTKLKDNKVNKKRIEVNSVSSIKNSANKLLMKQKFATNNIKTAIWFKYDNNQQLFIDQNTNEQININELPYPIISKHIKGSRGIGNVKHNNVNVLQRWMVNKNFNNYIFEKYYNYVREYRLHVDSEGCFYSCRKMLKSDSPQEHRWYRNNDHCVWIMKDNDLFDKPVNWEQIEIESVKALKAVGLDVGAIDLRIQSATNNNEEKRENPEFIIVEINSAPSFGDVTLEKYIKQLPKILKRKKYESSRN
jgi:glutathione synthase/RimK-type ligase-like ATP-grasp enzyme